MHDGFVALHLKRLPTAQSLRIASRRRRSLIDASRAKPGCSDNTSYYSTTIQNQMIKDKQYIEPGRVIDFSDETRFDEEGSKWKGQDGKFY
jgi:hypothetical protein